MRQRNHGDTHRSPIKRFKRGEHSPPLTVPDAYGTQYTYRWRFRTRGCDVVIPSQVVRMMIDLAGRAQPNETGGTLVGHYEDGDVVAIVEQVLAVRRGARSSAAHFFRPPDGIDGQLAEVFSSTAGKTHYLGEWHTHPLASPIPSSRDLRTMHELARSSAVATDTPLLIILGRQVAMAPVVSCTIMDANGDYEIGAFGEERIAVNEDAVEGVLGSGLLRCRKAR